jgi:hypothetical protein
MQRDLELAAGELVHLGGELLHVLRLEAVGAVARGQVPLGLRRRQLAATIRAVRQNMSFFIVGSLS